MSNENKDANHYILGPYPTKQRYLPLHHRPMSNENKDANHYIIGSYPMKTKMLTTTS